MKEIASDGLKGRVFETSLGDLNENEDAFRKFKLIIEETQGKVCLTNFHGMDITTDKLRSMIKKKQVGPITIDYKPKIRQQFLYNFFLLLFIIL